MPNRQSNIYFYLRVAVAVFIGAPLIPAIMWQVFLYLYAPPAPGEAQPWDICATARAGDRFESPAEQPVIDDAGCPCYPREMQVVELRVETDGERYSGHAFIHTPNLTTGFQTTDWNVDIVDYLNPFARSVPGRTLDDTTHCYDYFLTYRACPETVRLLEGSMHRHAGDRYQLGDWDGGRNCSTWARDRLRDAGLTPPPGDCPNRMARYMSHFRATAFDPGVEADK